MIHVVVFLQARIHVADGGTPPLSATTLVKISVTRNFFDPVFSPSVVRLSIPETTPIGTTVTVLNATDRDTVVSSTYFR